VQYKVRQGRKACTLVSGFELFGLAAPELAERLRVLCASSTSGAFSPLSSAYVRTHGR
jgi:translation initiation factor 2D